MKASPAGCPAQGVRAVRLRRAFWEPVHPGWGLVDAASGAPVRPENLALAEPRLATRW